MPFLTSVDIANRALQHCGATRIDATLGFTEPSKNASEVSFCYDKLRVAELRRNTWVFAKKRVILRAIDANTMLLAPALWVSTTTYFVGSIVADQDNYLWVSRIPNNLGYQPGTTINWEPYFGPMTVSLYASTDSYNAGELAYTAAGDGTNRVYLSLQSANSDVPATATAWSATSTYSKNQVVTYLSVAYMSLVDLNTNQTPVSSPSAWATSFVGGAGSIKWLEIGGAEFPNGVALSTLNIVYPIGAGPSTQSATRNVYRLPAGYLRPAPVDPKAGVMMALGGPSGLSYSDWVYEGKYIVSSDVGPIVVAFIADVVDVTMMDPMFCEGLAARIGLEVCEAITQSNEKIKTIASEYKMFMGEARTINAIESGTEDSPDDPYIACRI